MSVLWSGLVSRLGALHKINLVAPFPLGQTWPRKITMTMTMTCKNGERSVVLFFVSKFFYMLFFASQAKLKKYLNFEST